MAQGSSDAIYHGTCFSVGCRPVKYMGSKRAMLKNGLGDLLAIEAPSASRFIDLFCGGASVSWFAATELGKEVVAYDLQRYAVTLAAAVIKRSTRATARSIYEPWLEQATRTQALFEGWKEAVELDSSSVRTSEWRRLAQKMCGADSVAASSLIWSCYGGHYFSPTQALRLDAMLLSLPAEMPAHDLCLAATIVAASRCAASPGHTAQPFKATRTAGQYLRQAWKRDPFRYARRALDEICPLRARRTGDAIVGDANEVSTGLHADDLVFIDPPYSAVQYSRFYHVLETIARGTCGEVAGVGRYPPPKERPNSPYSLKGRSKSAIQELLLTLSGIGCKVVLTFPEARCSNGLSGRFVEEVADQYFQVDRRAVRTDFSTLGGNTRNRTSRLTSDELMLVLKSK